MSMIPARPATLSPEAQPALRAIAPAEGHAYMARAAGESLMLISLFQIVDLLLSVVIWIIIGQAILSWLIAFNVINTHNDGVRRFLYALDRMTEPMYRPIRRILPDFGGLDFSPMVLILLIYMLKMLLHGAEADVIASMYPP
jgi:YggT family protein